MEKKKILVINNAAISVDANGFYTDKFNAELLQELKHNNNEVSFLHFEGNKTDFCSFNLKTVGIDVVLMKLYRNKLLRYFIAYIRLFFIILRYDFVYFYYPSSFKYAAFFCKLFGKPYGLYVRGMYGVAYDKLSAVIYKNAKAILTVSEAFNKEIDKIVGEEKAKSIRPMIPLSSEDIVYDRVYSNDKKEFTLLYFARVAKEKGVEELLKAFKKVSASYSIRLVFVGNGEFFEQTKVLVKELDLEQRVSLEGICTDEQLKRNYFLNADMYILPTYHEGFPRTLYEAMIFGTPIITTFVGGIPALMKDKYNCIEIEPKSEESIVEGLEYAINNYEEMIRYAKNGFDTVSKIVDVNRLSHAGMLNEIIRK